jgi:hypothetical protein
VAAREAAQKRAVAFARQLYSKKNENKWRAAAYVADFVGLITTEIPGVDLVGGYVTGAIAAAYDCNYGQHVQCLLDGIGMFTGGLGDEPKRIPKAIGLIMDAIGGYGVLPPGDTEQKGR